MEASVLDKKDEQALAILRQFADEYEVQLARGGDGATYTLGGLPLYVIAALMYEGAPPFRKRQYLVLSVEPLPEGESPDMPLEHREAGKAMTLIVLKRRASDDERRRYTATFPVVAPHCYEILEVRERDCAALRLRATGLRSHYVSDA